MKLSLFQPPSPEYRRPQPAVMPELPDAHFFALYRGARSGGDFYDFACVEHRVLTLFCDISGKRDSALNIAAALQERFRQHSRQFFSGATINEAELLSELLLALNREIIATANGPRYTPAFLSCFNLETGTLTYINAGHMPALVRDEDGINTLDPNGFPLGLFSHITHESQFCVVRPGASLLLVSRGMVETKQHQEEFGLDRVKEHLLNAHFDNARELCASIHAAAQRFLENKLPENDLTTLAMVRPQATAQGATA